MSLGRQPERLDYFDCVSNGFAPTMIGSLAERLKRQVYLWEWNDNRSILTILTVSFDCAESVRGDCWRFTKQADRRSRLVYFKVDVLQLFVSLNLENHWITGVEPTDGCSQLFDRVHRSRV